MGKLEKITYICLITLSMVSLGVILENRFFKPAPPGQPSERSLIGKQEKSVPPAAWKGSKKNVVLLLSTTCHFCAESVPLYQQLSTIRQQTPKGVAVFVASFEQPDKMRKYLSQNNVSVDDVFQVPSGFVGVSATPTIFMVDTDGIVRKAYFGKLDWIREKQFLGAVNGGDL